MSQVIIRLAQPSELRQVQDLNHELFVSDNRHLHDLKLDWPYQEGEAYFRKKIAGEADGVCFVAVANGRVIGYLAGGLQKNHPAYTGLRAEIENICVTATARSDGIGHQLVTAFYNWCRQHKAERVMVNAYAANQAAIDFYKQTGFTPYSTTLWLNLANES